MIEEISAFCFCLIFLCRSIDWEKIFFSLSEISPATAAKSTLIQESINGFVFLIDVYLLTLEEKIITTKEKKKPFIREHLIENFWSNMTSVISSRSNVALLVHTLSKTSSNERSYSKRLYTFFHYEHSTHPRRWIILFFLILFISISLAWIVAGLIRFRTTASYLESCSQGKVQCVSGTFLICSLSSSVCLCPERMFWDENKRKCLTVKSINQSCSTHQQCDTDQNLICQTNSRTCQCPPNSYYHLSSCTRKLLSYKEKNHSLIEIQ